MSSTRTQCRVEREREDAIDGVDICRKPQGHDATDPEHHDPATEQTWTEEKP